MFELLNDLFVRSDDEEYDDEVVEVYEEREDGEESYAATNIAEAEEGEEGESVARATDTSTAFAVAKDELEANDASNNGGGQIYNKQSNSSGQEHDDSCCEENNGEDNDYVDEEDEWNGLFEEFKTGILSLKSSVSAVSAVAANVFTGAIEEAHASMTSRPIFVLSAANEDEDEYFEDEGDETIRKFANSDIGGDNDGEDIDEEEDEEVNFLEDTRISNEGHEPCWLNTPPQLESLDVVKMRQRLSLAEEQRNTLMQMVEERNEDICKLRFDLDQQKLRRLRRQSEQTNECAGRSCSDDDRIQWLKGEVEWWNYLISSNYLRAKQAFY